MTDDIRIGIVGAGYIAGWHLGAIRATRGLRLTAVCDRSQAAAQALAAGTQVFTDLGEMIAARVCDAALILTPPNLHRDQTVACLHGGLHVLVEKPAAETAADLSAMTEAARASGRHLMVSHNFLGLPGHTRLSRLSRAGDLGRLSSLQVNWALPLAPLRSGPFGLWLLQSSANLLRELGPHPFSLVHDLVGPVTITAVDTGQPVALPGGGTRPQGWRILGRAGGIEVTVTLSLVETIEDRSVTLRGSSGLARLDFGHDVLTVLHDNTSDLILNPLRRELSMAAQHLRAGVVNAARQTLSLNQRAPYGLSFRAVAGAFRDSIRSGRPDPRFGPDAALAVTRAIDEALALLPPESAPAVVTGTPKPDVMVIGGTGFIGRNLTRALVARGHQVRVLSRGQTGPFADIADRVETCAVSPADRDGLTAAMEGIRAVFNLARSLEKTWEDALARDVAPAVTVAEAALAAGVDRLIFTGTIASYDMSDPARIITEDTPFGDLTRRNLYARSKAECEARLTALHVTRGLPLVIARPGIVVGEGGPLQHWGIGRWHGAGAVRLWGNGRNVLPFVLADDVSAGLIAMIDADVAVGRSYNLVGPPMLSGRDYFDAIHRRLGARLRVSGSSLTALWAADAVKAVLKSHVLRKPGVVRPSRADWFSRAHLSRFDNARPRADLGWTPETDRDRFLEAAVDRANLFGV